MIKLDKKKKLKIVSADIETDPFDFGQKIEAFSSCVYYRTEGGKERVWENFCKTEKQCITQLLARILSLRNSLVYFHNGGGFDYHYLLPYIDVPYNIFAIKGKIVSITFRDDLELRDSLRILPAPLSAFGNKDEIDYNKLKKNVRFSHKEEILNYQRQDCRALHEAVTGFVTNYGLSLTIANRAMNEINKTGYKVKKLGNLKTVEKLDNYFRRYYYGGRVQCFEKGVIDCSFKYYDINSAYPFAMIFPQWHGDKWETTDDIKPSDIKGYHFATVKAYSNGAFPVRDKTGLHFPVGDGIYHVTGWEVIAALDCGKADITEVIECHIPDKAKDFKQFVNKFYELKKNADNPLQRQFAKILLNSGYGRFAINPREFSDYHLLSCDEYFSDYDYWESEGWELSSMVESRNIALIKKDSYNARQFANVLTSAGITGFVRAMILRGISAASRPLYCDTDSIIAGSADLKLSNHLGDWKLEGEGNSIGIAGKKLYAFMDTLTGNWHKASKGANLTPEQIMRVAAGEVVEWRSKVPTHSLSSAFGYLRRNIRLR